MASNGLNIVPSTTTNTDELKCSLVDIRTCPSARIIKILLKQLDNLRNATNSDDEQSAIYYSESEIAQSLHSILGKHDYTISDLLDDSHHLKYEHGIDRDDTLFDAAYDYFKDITTENGCNIDKCRIVERHYRDRSRRGTVQKEHDSDLLLDTMSMIHCYFLHSFDTQRLTKDERDQIMELVGSKSWTDVTDAIAIGADDANSDTDHDSDDEKNAVDVPLAMNMITNILALKKGRGRLRFSDANGVEEAAADGNVDFGAMSRKLGIEEELLSEGLSEYKKDRNKLIGDLIDVVYGDTENLSICNILKMEDDTKETMSQKMLYEHFHYFQLDTNNLIELCRYIVERKELQIDVNQVKQVMTSDNIDGRMFDKDDVDHYQSKSAFNKRFKGIPICKVNHIGRLYSVVKKWKYVEVLNTEMESKEDEKEDDNVDDDVVEQTKSDQADVYAIGKQFLFWNSQKRHRNYVKAKFKDMKEEVMQNTSILQYFPGLKDWNDLMNAVNAIVSTKAALRISSNGRLTPIYNIGEGEPFDAEHLCALKLYTDYTKLCAAFCSLLRRGDPKEIEGIANWIRILTETVQCFGSSLVEENKQKTYFRGVNRAFMFMTIVSKFNLPQSTTSDVK